jgi:hypothetical protein
VDSAHHKGKQLTNIASLLSVSYFKPMLVKHVIPYNYGIFFITATCHNWLPLIEKTNSYNSVYKWFDHLKQGTLYIGYTIMPIIFIPSSGFEILARALIL